MEESEGAEAVRGWRVTFSKAYDRINRFITDVDARANTRDAVDFLRTWYEAYERLMLYIGSVAVGIVVFTVTFLLKDYVSGAYANKLQSADLVSVRKSLVAFGICLLFVAIDLLATYNWFAHGLEYAIKQTGIAFRGAGESFEYRKRMGSMSFWGYISLVTGYGAGIALLAGIYFYIYAAWHLLTRLLAGA